jgi:hypothetical protein
MRWWVLGLSVVVGASFAHAGVLAPKRASDVVRVSGDISSGDCSPYLGFGRQFDTVLHPDGTSEPLEVPKKRALVVTNVEILGFGGSTGTNDQVRLFIGTPTNGLQLVSRREQRFDADGRVFYVLSFEPGLVVPSGGLICMNDSSNVTLAGTLTGYFTKQN